MNALTFQEVIIRLQKFWSDYGCIVVQPTDVEVGAGTLNKNTFLRVLDEKPWNVAYVEPCRRPTDGRFGENPNRLQHYYQYQVILQPAPENVQDLYLDSLRAIGMDPQEFDVRFVEDDWEHPALGAAGLGWEVWARGMEVTQFTYFQQCGGMDLPLVASELTYGLERLAMYLQNVDSVYDLVWTKYPDGSLVYYRDVHHQDEVEWSHHNFNLANVEMLERSFNDCEAQALALLESGYVLPAYDYVLKCSHAFNVMDARGAVGTTARAAYLGRVRKMARGCAELYVSQGHAGEAVENDSTTIE